ncbi:MAG: tRNA (N(6)-L-threonylcarbamoyladenosine(37)-C(2))-methylthiotransferase [Thermoplasmata archaeon]
MRILVEAYGCTMNRGEAEEFTRAFIEKGHAPALTEQDADACAIFTCGVIETTERHMLKRIKEISGNKKRLLLVCGCLVTICPEKILRIAPHAKLIGPARQLEGMGFLETAPSSKKAQMRSSVGILPVATGCAGSCTYCITKVARGRLCSRPPAMIFQRLESLVARGAAEVQLCAQDTAIYGRDMGLDLAALVEKLSSAGGDFMMRIGMMNPANVMADLGPILRAFQSQKVFKFLHLPVQSGSDAVLERMGRRHTASDFRAIVSAFRERFPGMALSTDIIVGFPGETDGDFTESMELMRETKPDIINVTRFSPRPGTQAHSMEPKIHGRTAKERSRAMAELRFELTRGNYREMIGRTVRALATERRVEGTAFLRTPEYRPVVVDAEVDMGQWYDIRVKSAEKTHLRGTLENVK